MEPGGPEGLASVVESLVQWCRDTMAGTRRPYGVDHFDLALAYGSGGSVKNLRFNRLRVAELYGDAFTHQLLAVLGREAAGAGTALLHLSAGLFAWGDALHGVLEDAQATA